MTETEIRYIMRVLTSAAPVALDEAPTPKVRRFLAAKFAPEVALDGRYVFPVGGNGVYVPEAV